jgi:hypothetical protein
LPTFPADEVLYRRFTKPNIAEVFKFNAMSVKLGALCTTPKDALYRNEGPPHPLKSSVASISVAAVEGMVFSLPNSSDSITFKVIHSPYECDYAHAEVFTYINGIVVKDDKTPRPSVRKQIRDRLVELVTVCHPLENSGMTLENQR